MIGEDQILHKFSHQGGGRPSPGASSRLLAKTRALSMGNPPWDTLCGEGGGGIADG
jgi:hypothetical protein